MTLYSTPTDECRAEQEVKKSRFIGIVTPCLNRVDAMEKLALLRLEYPDARHICWAFVCGSPGNYSDNGCSDDGEPSGTAGKPILNVLQHNPVSDIAVYVIRYFGGIKLGAGGLVRAYSNAASTTLENTPLQRVVTKTDFKILLPYSLEDRIRRLIEEFSGSITQHDYTDAVVITVELALEVETTFKAQCSDIGKGEISFQSTKDNLTSEGT